MKKILIISLLISVVFLSGCQKCEYKVIRLKFEESGIGWEIRHRTGGTLSGWCMFVTRSMMADLNDTWGSNTNNADQISKSMLEMYEKCIRDNEYVEKQVCE